MLKSKLFRRNVDAVGSKLAIGGFVFDMENEPQQAFFIHTYLVEAIAELRRQSFYLMLWSILAVLSALGSSFAYFHVDKQAGTLFLTPMVFSSIWSLIQFWKVRTMKKKLAPVFSTMKVANERLWAKR